MSAILIQDHLGLSNTLQNGYCTQAAALLIDVKFVDTHKKLLKFSALWLF